MSFTYWLVLLLPIPFCLVVTIVMNIFLFKNQELKEKLGYPFQVPFPHPLQNLQLRDLVLEVLVREGGWVQEGDVMWTSGTSIMCPLVCLLAGLFAGESLTLRVSPSKSH